MSFTKFIHDEFIYGGHWLSIGASSLALTTMILFDLEIKIEFLLISYLGTRCIYLYNFYKEIDYDKLNNHCRTSHLKIFGRHLPMIVFFMGLGILFY